MITTEQYERLRPHRDFIISKRGASEFYGLQHHAVWSIIHSVWFEMKGAYLDGNCFDCVQAAYNNFADYIDIYEAQNGQSQEAETVPEETNPAPKKRGRKPKK